MADHEALAEETSINLNTLRKRLIKQNPKCKYAILIHLLNLLIRQPYKYKCCVVCDSILTVTHLTTSSPHWSNVSFCFFLANEGSLPSGEDGDCGRCLTRMFRTLVSSSMRLPATESWGGLSMSGPHGWPWSPSSVSGIRIWIERDWRHYLHHFPIQKKGGGEKIRQKRPNCHHHLLITLSWSLISSVINEMKIEFRLVYD